MNTSPRLKFLLASIAGALTLHVACGVGSASRTTPPAHADEPPPSQTVQIPQPLKSITAESDPNQLVTLSITPPSTQTITGPFVLTDATGGYADLLVEKGSSCTTTTTTHWIGRVSVTSGDERREMHGRYFIPEGSVLCVKTQPGYAPTVVLSGFRPYAAARP
jgi:hypothetical protein